MKSKSKEVKKFKLSTGYEFTATPVNSMLVYDAQEQYPLPEPPKIHVKQGGHSMWVDNPSDSLYQTRFDDTQRKRNMAALSCIIMHGVSLVGAVPESDTWLRKVRRAVNLSQYEDEYGVIAQEELEYLFLRYVAIASADDYQAVFDAATLTEEAVGEAIDSFPGDAEGD